MILHIQIEFAQLSNSCYKDPDTVSLHMPVKKRPASSMLVSAQRRNAKRQLTRTDSAASSIASEDYPTMVGRAKDVDATFITCKQCDMQYPPDRETGFECTHCKCDKFATHFSDPDMYIYTDPDTY